MEIKKPVRVDSSKALQASEEENQRTLDLLACLVECLTGSPHSHVKISGTTKFFNMTGAANHVWMDLCERDHCVLLDEEAHTPQIRFIGPDEKLGLEPLCLNGEMIRSHIGVDIRSTDGFRFGTLCILNVEPSRIGPEAMSLLDSLAEQFADLIELRLYKKNVDERISYLDHLAGTDELTGAINRRYFMKFAEHEYAKGLRDGGCSICMLDVDNFKKINDDFGHQHGDQVLKVFASMLIDELREVDKVARFGGDEFCVLFPGIRKEDALIAMNRFAMRLREYSGFDENRSMPITFSAGIADSFSSPVGVLELIEKSDENLYAAKRAGRNAIRTSCVE